MACCAMKFSQLFLNLRWIGLLYLKCIIGYGQVREEDRDVQLFLEACERGNSIIVIFYA